MKITLCVKENKIECKESGSDIKAVYQIPHFDLRKQRKNKKSHLLRETKNRIFELDWKLCPGIHSPPLKFSPLSFRESPPLIQKQHLFLKTVFKINIFFYHNLILFSERNYKKQAQMFYGAIV